MADRILNQGSENREISRYETTTVYTHPEAKVDIVLVHGLNGEPDTTWTAMNGTFWPLDLLPTALKETHANILVYGYNADVYSKRYDRTTSHSFIHEHAQDLVANLTFHRQSEGTYKNTIIWVCHSLGGIIVKRALLYSHHVRDPHLEDLRSIFVSTFGLIFLGTPHNGSDAAAWGVIIQAMANALIPKRFFDSEPVLLKTLRKDNQTLANINSQFLDIHQRFEAHMVHENQKTDIKGKRFIVVDAKSAGPLLPGATYYGIEACHSDMCKFDSIISPGFRNINNTLQKWVEKAPCLIQERWLAEEEKSRRRFRTMINEMIATRPEMRSQRDAMLPYPLVSSIPGPEYPEDDDDGSESRVVQKIMGRRSSQRSSRLSHEENNNQFSGRTSPFIDNGTMPGYKGNSLPYMSQHFEDTSEEPAEYNPFMGISRGASPVPSMDVANADLLGENRGLLRPSARHSDTSLDADIGHWAAGQPLNSNPVSSLRPLTGYQQHLSSHRRTLAAGETLSSSLPNSLASSTLRPSSSAFGGYASQPTSRHSSPRPEISKPHISASPRTSHAPSITAIEPSPRYHATPFNNASLGYQAWQLRRPEPWSFEDASLKDVSYSPRQCIPSESAEMVKSGSRGMHVNGHLDDFGPAEPGSPQIVYPSAIESPSAENQDTMVWGRGDTNSQFSDHSQQRMSK